MTIERRRAARWVCGPLSLVTCLVLLHAGPVSAHRARSRWWADSGIGPSARAKPSMVFDPTSQAVVLFSGLGTAGGAYGDSWSFGGRRWSGIDVVGPGG